MKIRILILMPLLWLVINTNANPEVIKIGDLRYQGLGATTVYQKFQTRVSTENIFTINTSSNVLLKVPGVTLVLQHGYPMLYELNFEAVCRVNQSGVVIQLDFLYNDQKLFENKLNKNDNSSGFGSGRDWWFGPTPNAHHFVCSRSETVYLASGTHVIDVGARIRYFQPMQMWNGQLTVKLTQYDFSPKTVGNLPMLYP